MYVSTLKKSDSFSHQFPGYHPRSCALCAKYYLKKQLLLNDVNLLPCLLS